MLSISKKTWVFNSKELKKKKKDLKTFVPLKDAGDVK